MAISGLADWIRPSAFAKDLEGYITTRDGAKDTLEGVINVFDWMKQLGFSKEFSKNASDQLEPVKQTLAIPGFVVSLGNVREKWHALNKTDDKNAFTDFTQSVAISTLNLSESAMAADSWGVVSLKEGMKSVKTTFWSAIGLIDGIDFFREISKAEILQKEMDEIIDEGRKNIWSHKIQNCYLKVLKSVIMIAMASISLVTLLFASLAHGFLFSPVVFLSLSSAWLVLTYVTHFYGKTIEHWEKAPPVGKV